MNDQVPGIRIVTINTGKCDGLYRVRIAWLLQELQRLSPDVVALQESYKAEDDSADTAAFLADGLEMDLFWSPARFKPRETGLGHNIGWSGMALLTQGSWLETETIVLPSDPADGDRVAQIAVALLEGFTLTVANAHLTYLSGADTLRREQLSQVLTQLLVTDPADAKVLCGDFNTTAGGPVLKTLLEHGEGLSIKDTFALGGGSGPRSTLPPRDDPTSVRPCIDYIFSLAADQHSHRMFACSEVVLNRPEPETGVLPSDHYGVATTLVVPWNRRS